MSLSILFWLLHRNLRFPRQLSCLVPTLTYARSDQDTRRLHPSLALYYQILQTRFWYRARTSANLIEIYLQTDVVWTVLRSMPRLFYMVLECPENSKDDVLLVFLFVRVNTSTSLEVEPDFIVKYGLESLPPIT